VLILGNHGLVVGATSCGAAEELMMEVERRLSLVPRISPPADYDALAQICASTEYRPAADPMHHALATDPHNLSIANSGSLYPDHVIFLGPALPALFGEEDSRLLAAGVAVKGLPPPAVLVQGKGTVIRTDANAAAQALLTCLALVITRLPLDAEVEYLSPANEQALLNWDAEQYRQQMTARR
jgi:rhamnose utilization protein RhaD (predicted bifunctional aldolase and dehydrogenase)